MKNTEQDLADLMKECGIDTVLTLPCDRIKNLLALISRNFKEIPMTREEDGIGIAAGLYLAGKKPAMVIQSTGLGNSLNSMSSLHKTYDLPLPILASWRGVYGEGIIAQVHFGKCLPGILKGAEIPHIMTETHEDLPEIKKAVDSSYESGTPFVVLMSPKMWEGSKAQPFVPPSARGECRYMIDHRSVIPSATHTRYEMIKAISPYLEGKAVISNIGVPSKELYAAIDQPSNFYMLGSLGLATPIGTGVAIGHNKEVIVMDGDGGILMNPNCLGSAVQENPENLTIIAFDNGAHGSTGNQMTFSRSMDLELLAKAYGFKNTVKVSTPEGLWKALESKEKGPRFIHTIIVPKNADVPNIPMSPQEIRDRFAKAIR